MAKENLNCTVLVYSIVLFLMLSAISSCSKAKDQKEPAEKTFTIDLNDQRYTILQKHNSSAVIAEKNLIICNWEGNYACAYNSCSYCTSGLKANNLPTVATWICESCTSEFGGYGEVIKGPAATRLKAYPVTKSGNILTITISK
jgi:Rieske Fe-S protein